MMTRPPIYKIDYYIHQIPLGSYHFLPHGGGGGGWWKRGGSSEND